jgi:hypothetical protein
MRTHPLNSLIRATLAAFPLLRGFGLAALCLTLCACGTLQKIENVFDGDSAAAAAAPASNAERRPLARPGKDFYTGKYSFVRIEASEAGAHSGLPLALEAERLATGLAELKGIGSDFKGKPLFSPDELTELVPVLVDACAKAHDDQDVVFAIAGKHSQATLFETESVTTGRIFAEHGRLQLILGMTRINFGDELRGNHTLKPFVPGSRTAKLASASPVGGASWTVDSAARPDWLSADPATLGKPAAAVSTAGAVSAPTAAAAPVVAAPALARPATEGIPAEVAERRLSTLDRLRQKGLISEQEYQDKRKAVLDGL